MRPVWYLNHNNKGDVQFYMLYLSAAVQHRVHRDRKDGRDS